MLGIVIMVLGKYLMVEYLDAQDIGLGRLPLGWFLIRV